MNNLRPQQLSNLQIKLIGEIESFKRLADLASKAKKAANLPEETILDTIVSE